MDSNITVEREASFEVSRQNSKKYEDTLMVDLDPFPFDSGADLFSKRDVSKVSKAASPDKVMNFDDRFSQALDFTTPSFDFGGNNSHGFEPLNDDLWGDKRDEIGRQSQSQPERVDVLDFNPLITEDDNESTSKILFPDDQEPILNTSTQEETKKMSTFTPDLASSIKKRYEEQKGPPSDNLLPDDIGQTVFEESSRSRHTNWTTSSGQDMKKLFSATCISLPSFAGNKEGESTVDNNVFNKTGANDDTEVKQDSKNGTSRWNRLMAKLSDGAHMKANILQVRRKIMSCQRPDNVVEFSAGIEKNNLSKEINFEGNETVSNESAFSYKSLQQFSATILSTGQDLLSIPSDASTHIRIPNKGRTNLNGPSDNNILKLCIDLYEASAFQTLMSDLEGNVQVEELHVFRSWDGQDERTRTTEDISLLFKTIRSLSGLKMLNLANFLVEEIHFVSLTQWKNEKLQAIRIHLCRGALSKRLLDILASLPALKELSLEMNESFPFHLLLNSMTLESLTIVANGYSIDNLHANELIQRLPKNETLKKLTIEPPLQSRTFKLLVASLSKNTGVGYLRFSLLPGNQFDINRAMCELANTLMDNATLKSIRNLNHSKIQVNDQTSDAVMKALSENYIIEDFLVFDEERWFRERKRKILKENKMEFESIFPQIFTCGENAEDHHDECVDKNDSLVGDASHTVSDSLASIGDNVKSQAQRVASGALDFVGHTIGLK
mmetsp:Transcript_6286/g.15576  ORF Transcript_6286/g.15576 Transcript_6286/m.15576 type:complete len:724 (-) Transcript_6286:221-2392(-)